MTTGILSFGTSNGGGFPNAIVGNANGRPVITSAFTGTTSSPGTMAFTDAGGAAQSLTLTVIPTTVNATFGLDATTLLPNNGCKVSAAPAAGTGGGFATVTKDNTLIQGYNCEGMQIFVPSSVTGAVVISQCWFNNIDGTDSWGVKLQGGVGIIVKDCLFSGTGVNGGTASGGSNQSNGNGTCLGIIIDGGQSVQILRNRFQYGYSAMQFTPIAAPGVTNVSGTGVSASAPFPTEPYTNIVKDNLMETISLFPSGAHLENVNVSGGVGGLLIQHNTIGGVGLGINQTANIYISHDFYAVGFVHIDNNFFQGYTQIVMYLGNAGISTGGVIQPQIGNMNVTNNVFDGTNSQMFNNGGNWIAYTINDVPSAGTTTIASGNKQFNGVWSNLTSIAGL